MVISSPQTHPGVLAGLATKAGQSHLTLHPYTTGIAQEVPS